VVVTPKSATGFPDTGTPGEASGLIGYSSAPVALNVVISGKRKAGDKLTGHYEYSYEDGSGNEISEVRNSIVQWYKDGVLWATGTDNNLSDSSPTLTVADLDKPITFRVTPKSRSGATGLMVESSPMAIFNMTKTEYSVNDTNVPLVANPSGGEFYCDSTGAVSGAYFMPDNLVPGSYTVRYTLEVGSGGTTYTQKAWITLTVTESTAFFESFEDYYCYEDTYDVIYVRNSNAIGPKIAWQFIISNPAAIVSIINDSTIAINPSILGPGNKDDFLLYNYQVLVGLVPLTFQIVQPFVVDSVVAVVPVAVVPPDKVLLFCEIAKSKYRSVGSIPVPNPE